MLWTQHLRARSAWDPPGMRTLIRMITYLGTTLRHTALFRTQLGELSHALPQSRARFHCKTLTGVLELGRLGFCSGFPQARRLTRPGAKLVFVAFPREMVKPAKPLTTEGTEAHRGRKAFNNRPLGPTRFANEALAR